MILKWIKGDFEVKTKNGPSFQMVWTEHLTDLDLIRHSWIGSLISRPELK